MGRPTPPWCGASSVPSLSPSPTPWGQNTETLARPRGLLSGPPGPSCPRTFVLVVSSCPMGLSLDAASLPMWSRSEHHLLSALPCHFKRISWFLPLLLMSGRCGPLRSGLPTGCMELVLSGGRESRAGVGGMVCGSVQTCPAIWRQPHLMLEVAAIPAPPWCSQRQHTKTTRLKQLFCATAEQFSHNKYRGKRWAFPGSLMGVGQSHPWVFQIQPSA